MGSNFMPTKKPRVQFFCPPHLLEHLEHQAEKYCGGNRSEYLRHLVLHDMRMIPSFRSSPRKPHLAGEVVIPTASHGGSVLDELKNNSLFQKIKQQAE